MLEKFLQHLMQTDSKRDYLDIIQTEPYIDTILYYTERTRSGEIRILDCRFTFQENNIWSFDTERLFIEKCVKSKSLDYDDGSIDRIFTYYVQKNPEWNLKRYYTKPMRLLDNIYHCMRKGTAKEMLYKAGLDELAENVDEMDEINLLSSKPSDIYEGLSMRTLCALNCKAGAMLLSRDYNRSFVKQLQSKFSEIFRDSMNDAQCKYLQFLIEGDLNVSEAGRLFLAKKNKLFCIWAPEQYDMFIWMEKQNKEALLIAREISAIDPIYKEYVEKINEKYVSTLKVYLINRRQEYDDLIRRSNRKREHTWQERDKGYVIRYPQTINDFCRESIYMSNCLLTYVDSYISNDTTILFMRRTDDFNAPFITIEIFDNKLMQAYHRFNEDCTTEEAKWILKYCRRHRIDHGDFM